MKRVPLAIVAILATVTLGTATAQAAPEVVESPAVTVTEGAAEGYGDDNPEPAAPAAVVDEDVAPDAGDEEIAPTPVTEPTGDADVTEPVGDSGVTEPVGDSGVTEPVGDSASTAPAEPVTAEEAVAGDSGSDTAVAPAPVVAEEAVQEAVVTVSPEVTVTASPAVLHIASPLEQATAFVTAAGEVIARNLRICGVGALVGNTTSEVSLQNAIVFVNALGQRLVAVSGGPAAVVTVAAYGCVQRVISESAPAAADRAGSLFAGR